MANNWRKDEIDGDLLVDGNIECGGALHAAGDAAIGGDVVVGGVLRARNLVTPNKGWYKSARALKAAHPNAEIGSYAIVGDAPGNVWRKTDDGWVAVDDNTDVGDLIQHLDEQIAATEQRIGRILAQGRADAAATAAQMAGSVAAAKGEIAAYAAAIAPMVSDVVVLRFFGFADAPSEDAPIVFNRKDGEFRFLAAYRDRESAYQSKTILGRLQIVDLNTDVLYLYDGDLYSAVGHALVPLSPSVTEVSAWLPDTAIHRTAVSEESGNGLPAYVGDMYDGVDAVYAEQTIYVGGSRNKIYDVGAVTDEGDCPILERGLRYGTLVARGTRYYAYTAHGLMRIDTEAAEDGRLAESRLPMTAHDVVLFDGVLDAEPESWAAPLSLLYVGNEAEEGKTGGVRIGVGYTFGGVLWCAEAGRFVVAKVGSSQFFPDAYVTEWGDSTRWMNGDTPWLTKFYVNRADGGLYRYNGEQLIQI